MASPGNKDADTVHQLNGELYEALLEEEAEKVIKLCEKLDDHALHKVTIHNDTVLHKATYSKQTPLVLTLLGALPDKFQEKMILQNDIGNTILHEAATVDQQHAVDVAEKMLQKAPDLLLMTNDQGETALFRAARYGKTPIFEFLAEKISGYDEAAKQPFIQRDDKSTILHAAVLTHHFG